MKKLYCVISTALLLSVFSSVAFAATKEIEIDGEPVMIETFGNAELIDPVYIPEDVPDAQSVSNFEFYINDKTETDAITNEHAKWQVQTQAHLKNYKTGEKTNDARYTYTVSVVKGSRVLASYKGKTDNVYGGLTFSQLPTNVNLFIRITAGSHPAYDLIEGYGTTKFLD